MKMSIDSRLQSILICPYCSSGSLNFDRRDRVSCLDCGRVYPVDEDGIVDFVLAEEKSGEFFSYYTREYIRQHPRLDIADAPWKGREVLDFVRETDLNPEIILDLGCGSGEVLKFVSQKVGGVFAVGVDISYPNLRFALENNPQLVYVQSGVEHLPFKDGVGDLCLALDLLEHVGDVSAALSEIRRVARWLLIKVPLEDCLEGWLVRKMLPNWKDRFGHVNFFNQKSIRGILQGSSLEIAKEKLVYTPWFLSGFNQASLRSKAFLIGRRMARILGKQIYGRLFPLWYFALCRTG
ncbi:hypothetical protein B5M47_02855 [candidate division CPR3 bacterium 4484_211]|uniref:Uncharacterized protein n=1 Tax=candidate division CPR3 bacterium 4484_211 TaxID=1968527 RepID=A0A1W9NXH1_UNCC3|nr:MAG: hypothetical protein B5M47_02855 [candidate division CPR3 bacterium 4484_211]